MQKVWILRSSHQNCAIKKLVLRISPYSLKSSCVRVYFYKFANPSGPQLYPKETPTQVFFLWILEIFKSRDVKLYQEETLTQVFSCEYCNFFKNTYFEEDLRTPAAAFQKVYLREILTSLIILIVCLFSKTQKVVLTFHTFELAINLHLLDIARLYLLT